MRIPAERLTNTRHYLDPLNFATNFALFRDTERLHTRLATANYWARYGAGMVSCWLTLFDGDGDIIAEWTAECGDAASAIVVDSGDIRARFGLGEFTGQLFIHVVGAAGHDVVKYALDVYGQDDAALSCTHDAMPGRPIAMPASRHPAPANGSSCGSRTAIRARSRPGRSALPDGRGGDSRRSTGRSVRLRPWRSTPG